MSKSSRDFSPRLCSAELQRRRKNSSNAEANYKLKFASAFSDIKSLLLVGLADLRTAFLILLQALGSELLVRRIVRALGFGVGFQIAMVHG